MDRAGLSEQMPELNGEQRLAEQQLVEVDLQVDVEPVFRAERKRSGADWS